MSPAEAEAAEPEEPRRDTLGRRIHASRRGPMPTPEAERTTVLLQARVPRPMYDEVLRRAAEHPGEGRRRAGSGRAGVVKEALDLLFYGDAGKWLRRYRSERSRRVNAEFRARRAEERAEFLEQRALIAEQRVQRVEARLDQIGRMVGHAQEHQRA